MVLYLFAIAVFLVIYFFFTNVGRYLEAKYLKNRLAKYINALSSNEPVDDNFRTYKSNIKDSIKSSGITTDTAMIASVNFNVLENMFMDRECGKITCQLLEESMGIYRTRAIKSVCPCFWLNCILFLPKHILSYLEIKPSKFFVYILQFLYWIASFLFSLYKTEISSYIQEFLSNSFR